MPDEDFQLIPKDELENLKKEIEIIKKNPLKNTPIDLVSSINELNTSITTLIEIFKKAYLIFKEQEEESPKQQELIKKIENLEQQNKDIAKALVSFGDKFERFSLEVKEIKTNIQELHEKIKEIKLQTPQKELTHNQQKPPFPLNSMNNLSNIRNNNPPFQNPQNQSFTPPFPNQNIIPQATPQPPFNPINPQIQTKNNEENQKDKPQGVIPNIPPSMPPPTMPPPLEKKENKDIFGFLKKK